MTGKMRYFFVLIWAGIFIQAAQAAPLRLSGPPIAETIPLLIMAHDEADGFDARFIPWHSPDMLRAMVAGKQVDVGIVTTAVAATFASKGVDCTVAMIQEAPIWILSTRPGPDRLDSLTGTLLFPFGPGEMPELLYQAALAGRKNAVTIRHTGGAVEAVNLLLAGKGDHAMLSEPIASIAVARSGKLHEKGVPLLVKRVDMRKAWQRSFPGRGLAVSCMAFFGEHAHGKEKMIAFRKAYRSACDWVKQHPKAALLIAEEKYPALAAQMQHGGADDFDVRILSGKKGQEDALFFLSRIAEISSAAVGGNVPASSLFEVGE